MGLATAKHFGRLRPTQTLAYENVHERTRCEIISTVMFCEQRAIGDTLIDE
jgi:hypothetical protein